MSIDKPENIIKKATLVAIPAIALYAASNAKLADGIGFTYAVCIAACAFLFKDSPQGLMACLAACQPTLPLP